MKSQPLLSVVIANYNYGRFLELAIQSVLRLSPDDIELIVVDGGSTDDSVEVIRKHANRIAWWCSECDKGQSDAFNKGFAHARGKYLTWVNADDVMIEAGMLKVLRAMRRHPECEWFTANSFSCLESGRVVSMAIGPRWYPKFMQGRQSPVVAFGPSTFFSKALLNRMGGVDVSCRFGMDTDLWIRFIAAGVKQRRVSAFCWAFRLHAASKTAEFGDHLLSDEDAARWKLEYRKSCDRAGYKASRLLHGACLIMRILDGSLLWKFVLSLSFREYLGFVPSEDYA